MLLVRHGKTVAVDHVGRDRSPVIEGIGLAVDPVSLGLVVIALVFDRYGVEWRPLKAAAQPQTLCTGGVIGHVVIGRQRARINRYRPKVVTGKGAHRRAGNNAAD